MEADDFPLLKEKADGINLAKTAAQYSDGIILGDADVNQEVVDYCRSIGKQILPFDKAAMEDGSYVGQYSQFYDQIHK